MTPKTDRTLELSTPEYLTDNGAAPDAEEITSLDAFLAGDKRKYERAVVGGRVLHFQGCTPRERDALLGKHTKDNGAGGMSTDNTMWMTDCIALTWVTGEGGSRILDTEEKAKRFHAEASATTEAEMHKIALRMLGFDKKTEDRLKNLDGGGGTVTSPTSPSTTSTLYRES